MRCALLVVLLVVPGAMLRAQTFVPSDGFWDRDGAITADLIDQAEKSVVIIDNTTRGHSARLTGVLISDGGRLFVVTNAHLFISNEDKVVAYLTASDTSQEPFPLELLGSWKNDDLAISVFDVPQTRAGELSKLGFKFDENGAWKEMPSGVRLVYPAMFASEDFLRRGREVMFLGFPLNEGTKSREIPVTAITRDGVELPVRGPSKLISRSPIARFGRIASKVDKHLFLIDAMVSHGNSGSPVFVRRYKDDKNGYDFAGIITGFKVDNVVFRSDDGESIMIPHNSGIGTVISATRIKEAIEEVVAAMNKGNRVPSEN